MVIKLTRKDFIGKIFSSGALVLVTTLFGEKSLGEPSQVIRRAPFHPNLFVGLESDGTVFIIAHRSEMGSGVNTALPRVLADEMDADWSRVKIIQATSDVAYGSQITVASRSILEFFQPMREMGASARLMLVRAAAREWSVPESECESGLHFVVHKPTGRNKSYGELASAASHLPVPAKSELRLKATSDWRYIGKDAHAFDLDDICTGRAIYGIDARIDGMVYAAVERPPVVGGKLLSYSATEALQVAGVTTTVEIEPFKPPHGFQPLGGVAVIANSTWAALQGRKKLQATWEDGPNAQYDSAHFKRELQETVRRPCKIMRQAGNVDQEFAKGGRVVEADYYVPHLAHATMEPPVALASFREGKATVWAPTQDPQGVQKAVANALGIHKENVTCHVTLLGGGFGRKAFGDYAVEAAVLSHKIGKPVKVVWSREDDIRHDFYLPVAAMYLKAALSDQGKPTAWLQRSAYPPIDSTFDATVTYGGWELKGNWIEVPFNVPNFRVEVGPAKAHARLGWLRSVASSYHTFALQSFVNEVAEAAGREPLDYLLELFGPDRTIEVPDYQDSGYPLEIARLRRVTELAADKIGWGKRPVGQGRGIGIAAQRYSSCYVASAVEVEVGGDGHLRVLRIDTAVDAGIAINPVSIRAQMEGSAVFGLSIALSGEITMSNGRVQQSNFHNYGVARIRESPRETNVYIVPSTSPPSGAGEAGVSVIPPAIANAVFAATGKRIRELPMLRHGTLRSTG